jgi:hypothetical protein
VKLAELLDELRNNILYDRGTSTGADDRLWDDTTLVRYINESQRRFAVRSYCLRDGTTAEVVNVTLVEGVTDYDLHPSIISVISAKISSSTIDLVRVGHSIFSQYNPSGRVFSPASFNQLSPNPPVAYSTDESLVEDDEGSIGTLSLHIWPAPRAQDAGTVIKLRVARKPLDDLTEDNLSAVPEIPVDHHLEMLDYAAYLALRIVDQDGNNDKRAAAFLTTFEGHVQDAFKLVLRKLNAPQPWGFGRNGWGGYCRDD